MLLDFDVFLARLSLSIYPALGLIGTKCLAPQHTRPHIFSFTDTVVRPVLHSTEYRYNV